MIENQSSEPADDYRIQVLHVNGKELADPSRDEIHVESIGKGGFRFRSNLGLKIEDKVGVLLQFPDRRRQPVFGRISYCESVEADKTDYCFSVLDGFYSLHRPGDKA